MIYVSLIEILSTWYRTPKRGIPKNAGRSSGNNEGAAKCWPDVGQSAGTRAGRLLCLFAFQMAHPGSTCASTLASSPSFASSQVLPAPLPALSGIPCFGVLHQVDRNSNIALRDSLLLLLGRCNLSYNFIRDR